MRKIKFLIAPILIATLLWSCENDGGTSNLELDVAGVPDVDKVADLDGLIDLNTIENGGDISIGVTLDIGLGDIVAMDLVGFYTQGSTTERVVLASNVTTFPATFTFTQQDLIDSFDTLNGISDFALGDVLRISADVTLENGSVYQLIKDDGTPNYGQDIANSGIYSVVQVFPVSCPSDLAGTYSVISSGTSTDPGPPASVNPISNFPYTVTITDNGGGSYTISDFAGGIYILWYEMYGLDFEVPGTFTDVCGTLTGSFPEPFQTTVELTGTVNPDGTITINWVNGYNDVGQSVLTPI